MKQRTWYLPVGLLWVTLLVSSCTFNVEVLTTPEPSSTPALISTPQAVMATVTPVAATPTLVPATPTHIPIRLETVSALEIFTSFQMGDAVRSLAFTPDGSVLAAAGGNSDDFDIHLWNVNSAQALDSLRGHNRIVWDLAFSPDGQTLVSVSSDHTALVWDWKNAANIRILQFPGDMTRVSFSPDGQAVALGGVDVFQDQVQYAAITTFSVGSWNPLLKFSDYLNITAMAYAPNGRWLVGGGTSRNVQVWRPGDGTSVFTLNHSHQALDATISPDSSTLATGTCQDTENDECTEGGVWLWDLPSGRLIQKLRNFPDVVQSVAFSPDGSFLIAASRDGTLRLYRTDDYEIAFEATPPGGINALAISPDGGLLATGNASGQIHLWKIVNRP